VPIRSLKCDYARDDHVALAFDANRPWHAGAGHSKMAMIASKVARRSRRWHLHLRATFAKTSKMAHRWRRWQRVRELPSSKRSVPSSKPMLAVRPPRNRYLRHRRLRRREGRVGRRGLSGNRSKAGSTDRSGQETRRPCTDGWPWSFRRGLATGARAVSDFGFRFLVILKQFHTSTRGCCLRPGIACSRVGRGSSTA
jgi:hypothetical protein